MINRILLVLALLVSVPALHAEEGLLFRALPTGSMKPTFDENYYLFGQKQDFHSLHKGDIIVYRSRTVWAYGDGTFDLIVHRIWQVSSQGNVVLCWGDSNPIPDDELITEDMYVCTITSWVPIDQFFK